MTDMQVVEVESGKSSRAKRSTSPAAPAAAESVEPDSVARICLTIRELQRQRVHCIRAVNKQKNALGGNIRRALGWSLELPAAERKKIEAKAAKLGKALLKGVIPEGEEDIIGQVGNIAAATAAGIEPYQKLRDTTEKAMKKLVKQLPVYPWLQSAHGFGEIGLAVVIGECADPPGEYETHNHLWKRLGLGVVGHDGTRQGGLRKTASKEDWIEHGYSAERHGQIYGCVSEPLMKHQGTTGPYRQVYDWKKAQYLERVEATKDLDMKDPAKWTQNRAHKAALRYMTTRLLKHLWQAWRGMS